MNWIQTSSAMPSIDYENGKTFQDVAIKAIRSDGLTMITICRYKDIFRISALGEMFIARGFFFNPRTTMEYRNVIAWHPLPAERREVFVLLSRMILEIGENSERSSTDSKTA